MNLPVLPVKRVFDPNDPEPCSGCGDCCKYVTAQIKSPRAKVDYDEIRWFLLHEGVQVFIDSEGWYIEFATRCRKLDGWRCGIYPDRPQVCSDYAVEDCTRYGDGDPHLFLFRNDVEYMAWLREHRPKAYEWVCNPRGAPARAAANSSSRAARSVAGNGAQNGARASSPRVRRSATSRAPQATSASTRNGNSRQRPSTPRNRREAVR